MQQSFLQSKNWAQFKASLGWLSHERDGIFVLERSLPLGKSLLYAPEVSLTQPKEVRVIRDKIRETISDKTIFFRLEILNPASPDLTAALDATGFKKSFEEIQPEHRQIISLAKSPEELLADMKSKGRYNINVAKRHGVRVLESDVKTFYKLYEQTAKRDNFKGRPENYFSKLIQHFAGQAVIYVATYNNVPVAGALVIFWQGTASYLYGASSNENRNVMAPYLLHWKIMEESRQRKMKYYDLLAIAPNDPPDGGPQHKYAGLRRFKQQLGGEQVTTQGSWDLILQPFWYTLYRFAEKLRRH